ncbi:TPA: FAD-dependent oxidoreductase [archaeon]|uniref:FAD-dependent oxidoreductase n=1 Tax=Candidatus Naiadarchaeum limnaeum TaxID=2756139 RepID=A0A832X6J5_9ARCH|nr:FAD-dependent oxidoreductase [Candidatus Naiadarchaeum limnaeum]
MEADQPKRFGTIFTKNIAISSNTKLFRLDFKKGESFNFLAGQFVMIARKTEEGKEVKRAYSFCSPPYEKGYTEYCVKIVSGGAISEWFDKLPLNTEVEIIGPYGKFVVTDFSKDILMIAAGTGIAPFRGMIKQLLHDGFNKKIHLLYGFHSEHDYLFRKEIEQLAAMHKNLIVRPTASIPENPSAWKFDTGRVISIVPKYIKDTNFSTFVCGPPPMVKDTVNELKNIGFNEKGIHLDVWG